MKIDCDGFTLEVIKVKGGWAQKATINDTGESRYRTYRYKREAEHGLEEWTNYQPLMFFMREFRHNFWLSSEQIEELMK